LETDSDAEAARRRLEELGERLEGPATPLRLFKLTPVAEYVPDSPDENFSAIDEASGAASTIASRKTSPKRIKPPTTAASMRVSSAVTAPFDAYTLNV
jgi:hypothetical protein